MAQTGSRDASLRSLVQQPNSQPVQLQPICVERIWGTDDLAPWFKNPPVGQKIGEIWLTGEDCLATEGLLAGRSLASLTETAPQLFGDPRREGFPLLIKILFPHEKLSVQVHPDDAAARTLGMPRGKTECWYVLSAEPGAQVAVGFKEPLSQAELKASLAQGTLESELRMLPVKTGDMVFIDAGTVHAIGPGMVVLETQQYSDTTYRLWDYGRPRELHVEAGAAATRTQTAAGLVAPQHFPDFTRLVSCPYFAVDRFDLTAAAQVGLGEASKLQILIALDDGCALRSAGQDVTVVDRGRAVILPAAGIEYSLEATRDAAVIRVLQP